MVSVKLGVIAIQGDVSEHVRAMERALEGRGSVVEVHRPDQVLECDGLIIPGGESTAISRQLCKSGMDKEIVSAAKAGKPIMATCAGLVLVSKEIEGDNKVRPLGLMDTRIGRNVFGSQRESFEAEIDFEGLDRPYRAVFIRAPAIMSVGDGVKILAKVDESIVAARQGNILCLAFHPELTDDLRIHRSFLDLFGGV